jgi:hypothetical protein
VLKWLMLRVKASNVVQLPSAFTGIACSPHHALLTSNCVTPAAAAVSNRLMLCCALTGQLMDKSHL